MVIDTFVFLYKFTVAAIYGSICILSLVFTFDLDAYLRINELLNLEFLSHQIINPLATRITTIDDWLISHNIMVGPILTLLSLADIVLLYRLLDFL
jgi:hypothetical protein